MKKLRADSHMAARPQPIHSISYNIRSFGWRALESVNYGPFRHVNRDDFMLSHTGVLIDAISKPFLSPENSNQMLLACHFFRAVSRSLLSAFSLNDDD